MPTKTTNELIGNKVWADRLHKFTKNIYHLKAIILRAWLADLYARSLRNRYYAAQVTIKNPRLKRRRFIIKPKVSVQPNNGSFLIKGHCPLKRAARSF